MKLITLMCQLVAVFYSVSGEQRVCISSFIAEIRLASSLQELLHIGEQMPEISDWKIHTWQKNERDPLRMQITSLSERIDSLAEIINSTQDCTHAIAAANETAQESKAGLKDLLAFDYVPGGRDLLYGIFERMIQKTKDFIDHCNETPCKDDGMMTTTKDSVYDMHDQACRHYDGVFMDQAVQAVKLVEKGLAAIRIADETCHA